MALEIDKKNQMLIFSIPNTEGLVSIQRKKDKLRSVGAYYLSNMQDDAEEFLNNLDGHFYVDLASSYYYCKDFFDELISKCGSMFVNDLADLDCALQSLKWTVEKNPELLFFKTYPPEIIQSRKYLKFPDQSTIMNIFKTMCLGDLTQIIIQKMSHNCFRIFVRPIKGAVSNISSPTALTKWLKGQGKIR